MSFIKEVEERDAEGKLKDIYDSLLKQRGKVANIMKVHSLNPNAMEAHLNLYMGIMFRDRKISREECEIIAVVVSGLNGCRYCIDHHKEALKYYWKDEERMDSLIREHQNLEGISDRVAQMIIYAKKLTENSEMMNQDDVISLKEVGLTDEEILNVNLVTSYFNFVNRIALGLGVEVSGEEKEGYNY